MQRKYYNSNGGMGTPNAGVPMHSPGARRTEAAKSDGEIITPYTPDSKKDGRERGQKGIPLFKDSRLIGKFETDDIILLCLIFLLLQSSEELDLPLLIALGYIFLSDKDIGGFLNF